VKITLGILLALLVLFLLSREQESIVAPVGHDMSRTVQAMMAAAFIWDGRPQTSGARSPVDG
jgi:glycopeptide antibiotics resistance protein